MAWQLIYTSAPRLIEAGRTGFGTVARHRAVSGMLAAAVERFSQFARLPGHDPRRVVHAHRILTVGAGTYHVLSCLQDAGSDYTGRTNHIAHHLIAEPREIRALSAAGLTPADVLLSMAWRSSWSEAPRYLDPSEEVDLSSFAPSATRAWAAVTGDPASAGILWSREAQKGCYLILPSGISGLELFRESLLVEPAQAWQTRFTTCLEPNDDLADFRWVALSSTSPMRVQVETSNRLVFDLTSPATLPAPPPREAPPPLIETVSQTTPAPAPLTPSVHDPMRPAGAAPAAVSSMGGWSPEPRRKAAKSNKSFIGISLIIAAVMIIIVVGALLRQNNLQVQARAEYDSEISRTWKEYDLKLEDTRKLLAEQSDLESGKELLKSYVAFFKGMRQLLHQPNTHAQLSLPSDNQDELGEFKKRLDEWADLHEKPWAGLNPGKDKDAASEILEAYRRWQDSRTAKWKQLTDYISLKGVPPPTDDLVQSLKDKAKDLLRSTAPERGSRDIWKQLFELPDQKSPIDSQVQHWLTLWEKLDASSYDVAQKAAADTSLPEWLRDQAEALIQQRDKKNKPQMAQVPRQESAAPAKPVVTIEDADAISASNPIYIYLLKPNENPADKITGLPVTADMQLYVGLAWDAHPRPDEKTEPKNGELKKWVSVKFDDKSDNIFAPAINSQLTVQFSNDGTLIAIPEDNRKSSDGVRIVARSNDGVHVLFDLRILQSKTSPSLLLPFVLNTELVNSPDVVESPEVGLLINRLRFIDCKPEFKLRPVLNLESPWDISLQNEKCTLSVHQSKAVTDNQSVKIQKALIQSIKDGIKSEQTLKSNLPKNQSGYANEVKKYDDRIAAKVIELSEAENKLIELEQPKQLSKPKSPIGECTLYALPATGIVLDICKVQIASPSKPPVNPTNNQ